MLNLQVVDGTGFEFIHISINGTVINPNGTAAIARTPNILGNN
jgi:hypothetical protein